MASSISVDNPIRSFYEILKRDLPREPRFGLAMRQGFIQDIVINPESSIVATPVADLQKKEILLNETHLTFLWTVCYSLVGIQELSVLQATYEPGTFTHNEDAIELLTLVTNWGVSLNTMHRSWPESVPRPDETNQRVMFTNRVFLMSTRYLILHEAAHLTLHYNSIEFVRRMKITSNKTLEDVRRLRIMEIQADDYAFDCLLSTSDNLGERYLRTLASVIAHLSNLFLLDNPSPRVIAHLDLDHRLKRVFKTADTFKEPYSSLLHLTLGTGILTFFELHKVQYRRSFESNEPYQTFAELEEYLFAVLERLKEI